MSLSLRRIDILGRFPFVRAIQVLDNPSYLIHLIKKNVIYKRSKTDYTKEYNRFEFLTGRQTLAHLMKSGASLARFSDGEFEQLTGGGEYPPDSDWCQRWSASLQDDLTDVLQSNNSKLLVAVDPPSTFLAQPGAHHSIPFEPNMWVDMRRLMWRFLNEGQTYGHSHLFVPANCPDVDWAELRKYLREHYVVIATGNTESLSNVRLGKETYFIECGTENAYERRDEIRTNVLSTIAQHKLPAAETIVMMSLGPTAGILARDLISDGIRVWDTGHMFKYASAELPR